MDRLESGFSRPGWQSLPGDSLEPGDNLMIDLKALFGGKFRITLDESALLDGQTREDRAWLQQIPAKYGHVYIHGQNTLGVYVRTYNDGSNRLGRLLALPGATLHQRGDREASVTVPLDQIDRIDDIIHFRRRRHLSPEQRAAAIERLEQANAARAAKHAQGEQGCDLDVAEESWDDPVYEDDSEQAMR
jgi:hypothetical protein